jgi:hypothetical protein
MKAIILTQVFVNQEDIELLKNTDIVKYALNQHAQYLNPTYRICSDYGVIGNLLVNYPQEIITIRDWAYNPRLIYAGQIQFRGSTMVACIEYLISKGYKKILIVGDNTVHQVFFQDRIKTEIKRILQENSVIEIYQYSNGNFNLPTMTVKQFIKEGEQ